MITNREPTSLPTTTPSLRQLLTIRELLEKRGLSNREQHEELTSAIKEGRTRWGELRGDRHIALIKQLRNL